MKDDNSRAKRPRKKTNIKQENENSPQVEAGKKTSASLASTRGECWRKRA
jgi:hypothetical protein